MRWDALCAELTGGAYITEGDQLWNWSNHKTMLLSIEYFSLNFTCVVQELMIKFWIGGIISTGIIVPWKFETKASLNWKIEGTHKDIETTNYSRLVRGGSSMSSPFHVTLLLDHMMENRIHATFGRFNIIAWVGYHLSSSTFSFLISVLCHITISSWRHLTWFTKYFEVSWLRLWLFDSKV